jgi:hypothetical protein
MRYMLRYVQTPLCLAEPKLISDNDLAASPCLPSPQLVEQHPDSLVSYTTYCVSHSTVQEGARSHP